MKAKDIETIKQTALANVPLLDHYPETDIEDAIPKVVEAEVKSMSVGSDRSTRLAQRDEDRALIISAMSDDLDDNGIRLILTLAGYVAQNY